MGTVPKPGPLGRTHFTRSTIKECWKAAGVLPFAFQNGTCWVLLGGEMTRTGPQGKFRQLMWGDFGGLREAIDEDSAATASRECSEETLGMLFGSCTADAHAVQTSHELLSCRLRSGSHSMCVVHPLVKGTYHMYVCQSAFVDPLMSALATEQNAAKARPVPGGGEKISFAWVRMLDILKAVSKVRRSYLLHARHRLVARGPGQRPVGKRLRLLSPFANSLRSALESGLLRLVMACQKPTKVLPHPQVPDVAVQQSGGSVGQSPAACASNLSAGGSTLGLRDALPPTNTCEDQEI